MSFSLDVNVFLYAANAADPLHSKAVNFLAKCFSGPDLVILTYPTILGFLRISTHDRVFPKPLTPDVALANIKAFLAAPHVKLVSEEDGFLDVYTQVTHPFPVRGNLVPDAHIAALLKQHGVGTIFTNDADFRKFSFLRVKNPFA